MFFCRKYRRKYLWENLSNFYTGHTKTSNSLLINSRLFKNEKERTLFQLNKRPLETAKSFVPLVPCVCSVLDTYILRVKR